jgi:hypothetical protein
MQAIGKRYRLVRAMAVLVLLSSWRGVRADTVHDALGDVSVTHRVNSGAVWAWGYNGFGELADGTALQPDPPVQMAGLAGLPAIAAGNDSALLRDDSPRQAAWNPVCVGPGDGEPGPRFAFSPVSGTAAIAPIASVTSSTLPLGEEGTVWPTSRYSDGWYRAGMGPQASSTGRGLVRTFITGITAGNTIS